MGVIFAVPMATGQHRNSTQTLAWPYQLLVPALSPCLVDLWCHPPLLLAFLVDLWHCLVLRSPHKDLDRWFHISLLQRELFDSSLSSNEQFGCNLCGHELTLKQVMSRMTHRNPQCSARTSSVRPNRGVTDDNVLDLQGNAPTHATQLAGSELSFKGRIHH